MSSEAALDRLIARIRELGHLPERIAPEVARELDKQLRANIAAGRGPDGKAWPLRLDGGQALQNAGAELTVRAEGSAVVATLRGNAARHHLGKAAGYKARGIVRRILPSRRLAKPLVAALKAVVLRAGGKVLRGG